MASEIQHDETRHRFTHEREGHLSYLSYAPIDRQTVEFVRTFTAPAVRGRGIGARIVEHALRWADAQGYRVVPSCWFVAEYVERHPQWRRLLAS
jgi:predicted GNAT family acetyltransferase